MSRQGAARAPGNGAGLDPDGSPRQEYCSSTAPLGSHYSYSIACYPRESPTCYRALEALEREGVEGFCLDRLRAGHPPGVIGRGHSSIVLLARAPWGVVAVKIRRADSKRTSLAEEYRRLRVAANHGAAPRPFAGDEDFIVMEYIHGPLLGSLLGSPLLPRAVSMGLEAARALDTAGILHGELARPWKHIVYSGRWAYILDYDSAKPGCGNPVKLVSGVLARVPGGPGFLAGIRRLLREYTRSCDRRLYLEIKDLAVGFLDSAYRSSTSKGGRQ